MTSEPASKTNGKSQTALVDELSEMQPRKYAKLSQPNQYAYMEALRDMVRNAVPSNQNIQILVPEDGPCLSIGNGKRKTYTFFVKGNNWVRQSSSDKSTVSLGDSLDVAELIEAAHETAKTSSIVSTR